MTMGLLSRKEPDSEPEPDMVHTAQWRHALVRLEKAIAANARDLPHVRAAMWKEVELVELYIDVLKANADDMRAQMNHWRTKYEEVCR